MEEKDRRLKQEVGGARMFASFLRAVLGCLLPSCTRFAASRKKRMTFRVLSFDACPGRTKMWRPGEGEGGWMHGRASGERGW